MFKFRERPPQLSGRWLESRISYVVDRGLAQLRPPKPHVLVTGFWRSGTTWVQEVLADALHAKTIFEPCSAQAFPPFNCSARFPDRDIATQEAYMPLSFAAFDQKDLNFLDGVFSGYCYSHFTFECRRSLSEAFRRRAVIKLVRAPFLVTALLERYSVTGIHITRHPCAVVDSLLRSKWDWTFEEVKFRSLFPKPEHIPASLSQDVAMLMRYDERPGFERAAAYWAFTEKHVSKIRSRHLIKVAYESLVNEGLELFSKLMRVVGGPANSHIDTGKISTQTTPDRVKMSKSERTESWRQSLAPKVRERIELVISDLWPEGIDYYHALSKAGIDDVQSASPRFSTSAGCRGRDHASLSESE